MITAHDLQEAIAYRYGKLDPEPFDAVVLAACHYLEDRDKVLQMLETLKSDMARAGVQSYTAAEPPEQHHYRYSGDESGGVGDYGDSEFLRAIRGRDPEEIWPIVDEAMTALKVISDRIYNGVMGKILQ